jgi:hypothetical protein
MPKLPSLASQKIVKTLKKGFTLGRTKCSYHIVTGMECDIIMQEVMCYVYRNSDHSL